MFVLCRGFSPEAIKLYDTIAVLHCTAPCRYYTFRVWIYYIIYISMCTDNKEKSLRNKSPEAIFKLRDDWRKWI